MTCSILMKAVTERKVAGCQLNLLNPSLLAFCPLGQRVATDQALQSQKLKMSFPIKYFIILTAQ